jgi:hypothetical protein
MAHLKDWRATPKLDGCDCINQEGKPRFRLERTMKADRCSTRASGSSEETAYLIRSIRAPAFAPDDL